MEKYVSAIESTRGYVHIKRAGASDVETANKQLKLSGTDQILAEIIQGDWTLFLCANQNYLYDVHTQPETVFSEAQGQDKSDYL